MEQINQITINDKEDKITPEEMTQARAVLGAIQWRAIQSGPQHSAKLSWLQSALPNGSKDTLHQINKLCRECHAQRFQSIAIKNLGVHREEDIAFACWTDAAVGNRPDMSSTGGFLVAMVDAAFLRGQKGIANPISWKSGKLGRVARSSLAAEIQALGDGEQELMYVRAEWAELVGLDLDLRRPEVATSMIPGAVIIDAKSVYDAFYKGDGASSAFSLKEKYAALDLMAITENLRKQNTPLLWVASDVQLADGLTKSAAAENLLHFLQRGQLWVVKYDPEFTAAKRKKAKGLAEFRVDEPAVPSDLTWQQLISNRHDSTISTENLWGMSVFMLQPCEHFAFNGGTCHAASELSPSACGFSQI